MHRQLGAPQESYHKSYWPCLEALAFHGVGRWRAGLRTMKNTSDSNSESTETSLRMYAFVQNHLSTFHIFVA